MRRIRRRTTKRQVEELAVRGARDFDAFYRDRLCSPEDIEVLSSGTEPYDRGLKWQGYQRLASLTDDLLVAQREVRVEQFQRASDGRWFYRAYRPGDRVSLGNGAQLDVDAM